MRVETKSFGDTCATLRYLANDFQVLKPGSHVKCAITDQPIPLDELQYWSVARQEAYADVQASLTAELRAQRR